MRPNEDKDHVLRERLESLEMEPPAAVWQRISEKMAKNHRQGGFLPWDVLLMLLVLAFPLVNFSMQKGNGADAAVIAASGHVEVTTTSRRGTDPTVSLMQHARNVEKSGVVAQRVSTPLVNAKRGFTSEHSNSRSRSVDDSAQTLTKERMIQDIKAGWQQTSGPNWEALPETKVNREDKESAEDIWMMAPFGANLPQTDLPTDSLCDKYVAPIAGGRFRKHEVYLGVSGNVNLPMIVNQNTLGAYGPKELAYSPAIGYQASVRLGYIYKNRYAIEIGFIFLSHMGQNYSDVFKGKDAKRQVRLDYMHVPLLLQYRLGFSHSKKFNAPWTIGLGAQIDILRSSSIGFDGNQYEPVGELTAIPDAKAYFSPIGISGVLNVERDFYLTKFMFVGVGLRATMSNDINSSDHPVDDDYGLSHNFAVGLHVSLNGFLRK